MLSSAGCWRARPSRRRSCSSWSLPPSALGAGFRGGEIVPVLFTGAAFGTVVGPLLGLSQSFGGALGMTAVFCGATNCPITSILLAYELFGGGGLPLYAWPSPWPTACPAIPASTASSRSSTPNETPRRSTTGEVTAIPEARSLPRYMLSTLWGRFMAGPCRSPLPAHHA